jgi:hypothetical protein
MMKSEKNKLEAIREILPGASRELFNKPNVVATGIGYKTIRGEKTGDLCLMCSVETKVAAASLDPDELIPQYILGIPTDVNPVGMIHSLQESIGFDSAELTDILQEPTGRFRPAPGGVSAGHFHITAGTLGCLVKKGNKILMLSNNHVLANSNQSQKGDIILQPAPHDGGTSNDQIARLSDFIPIRFENEKSPGMLTSAVTGVFNFFARLSGSSARLYSGKAKHAENLVDCAVAEPLDTKDLTPEILHIGNIAGVAEGVLDMGLKKSGRTTGFTTGQIEQVDVTVKVNFGAGKTALFTDQLMAGAMSQGGDSGSVVLNGNNEVVGLLFAGSTNTTIINRIQNVMKLLDIVPV